MSFAPKKICVSHGGEGALARKFRPRPRYNLLGEDVRLFKPKKRLSDGPASRALRVYYIRASATDEKIKALFRPFGSIRFFRRELDKYTAFLVFEKRLEALSAKKALEHTFPDIVIRAASGDGQLLMKAWSGLKIDCVEVSVAQPEATKPLTSFFKRV
ncbi:hypothetical protein AAVH_15555 [Aphelenchoides avenae]|nr:hypothetical protein AAVH_15555 [Aphelenchus avenae]